MSRVTINLGDAFLLDTGGSTQHLYVAIAETSPKKWLFVNFTTRKPSSEATCVIQPGPNVPKFIKHESVIAYKHAREMDASDLAKVITPGSPIPKEKVSPEILEQIQSEGLASKQLKNKYKKALKAFLERA